MDVDARSRILITIATREDLHAHLDRVEQLLDWFSETTDGMFTSEGIIQEFLAHADETRPFRLWLARRDEAILGVVGTKIEQQMDGRRVLLLWFAGGEDLDAWIDLDRVFEDYARIESCFKRRIIGRPGWERRLPSNWKRSGVVLDCLTDG